MTNCIFCEIIDNKEPAYIIYQNKYTTAFLDINPVATGHILVCPNEHIEKLNEIKHSSVSNALMKSLIHVSDLLIQSGICTDYSILQANGELADQDIKHLHFHIIPRHRNDQVHFRLETDKVAALNDNLVCVQNLLLFNK